LLTTEPAAFASVFEIKNHGIIPQIRYKKKGTPSVDEPVRNPISKTNQITIIKISGWINAHKSPRYDPRYCFLKSFLIRVSSSSLL
jgi:hypothetical protein